MKNQRRTFLKRALTITSVGASLVVGAKAKTTTTNGKIGLSEKAKRLMDDYALKYPIFQAVPGGEGVTVAMSESGCMGAVSFGWSSPDECYAMVKRLNDANIKYYGNYVLHFPPSTLDRVLEAGAKIVQFSWGIPDNQMVNRIRSAGAQIGIQVAGKLAAQKALALKPSFLICQGNEAGGHVQANDSLTYNLKEVISVAGSTHVLASGGIATGDDIRNALEAGASGVVLGTRLVATKESDVHDEYKKALVEAEEHSTVFTNCFDEGWNAMHRVLKNKTYEEWFAAGCPLKGNRPGEGDVLATLPNGSPVVRYSPNPPSSVTKGDKIREMVMYAGVGAKDIKDIPSVRDLIPHLWAEAGY